MNIFVFGDESGVFDVAHHDVFVFGGLLFFGREEREVASRVYSAAEREIKKCYDLTATKGELKGVGLKAKHKTSLFKSLSRFHRYAFVIDLKKVNPTFFGDKKTKQRYMDFAYKVGLKKVLERYARSGVIDSSDVDSICIRFDEHTTATNGRYELGEGIEAELKLGTSNFYWNTFHPPLFPDMRGTVELTFKDSRNDVLIRASDIVANVALYNARRGTIGKLAHKVDIVEFPKINVVEPPRLEICPAE